MKYVTIIIIAFVLAIFAQSAITTETVENTGTAESAATTLRFAIGQPAVGARSKEAITLQSGYVLVRRGVSDTPSLETDDNGNKPDEIAINSISPNPFNAACAIEFTIGGETAVNLEIVDISGRIVDTPIDGEFLQSGQYELKWSGNDFASGTYFVRLKAGDQTITKRAILMK